MKKILTVICCLCLFVNISFAFDPYADEEQETRSKSKLYWGILMTLVGGFLAYDGFSQEEVDISKPSVDYGGCINAMWQQEKLGDNEYRYFLYTGCGTATSSSGGVLVDNELNKIYNNGNVDLTDVVVKVRYLYANNNVIDDIDLYHNGVKIEDIDSDGYFVALGTPQGDDRKLGVNKSTTWSDNTTYQAEASNVPHGENSNEVYYDENALKMVNIKVTYKYKHKYKKQNKSDIEGVAGLMVATAGIYFIVDYFMDLHKFNQYMKRNDINIRLANAPNEYKLLFQKRL